MLRCCSLLIAFLLLIGAHVAPAYAQEDDACRLLCTPEVAIEPSVAVEPLFGGATVEDIETGATSAPSTSSTFELVLAVGVPTALPRVELTGEAIWSPFADTDANPFTGQSAEELGVESVADNPVELEFELNLMLLTAEETGGWVEAHFDIVDQLSPAERPGDTRLYTHKLNFELDVSVAPFHRFEEAGYLRHVELEGSLDYMATGIPQRGDVLGGERFLDDASPWSFTAVLVLPLAPLSL